MRSGLVGIHVIDSRLLLRAKVDLLVDVEFSHDVVQVERVENDRVEKGEIAEDDLDRVRPVGLLKVDQTAEKIARRTDENEQERVNGEQPIGQSNVRPARRDGRETR